MVGGGEISFRIICVAFILFFTSVLLNLAKQFESELVAENQNPILPETLN